MKSQELIETLSSLDNVLVVMHDNPDPDAIASAWCVVELAKHGGIDSVKAIAAGGIVRAENLYMVESLNPPIQLISEFDNSWLATTGSVGAVLVDCGAGATNHLVTRLNLPLVGVIDHHQKNREAVLPTFSDVRLTVAACASITASYLIEQHIAPSQQLATAIWYALRTETCAYESRYSQLDRDVLLWATCYGSPSMLAEIENAPLTRRYFSDLKQAIESTQIWNDTAFCWLAQPQGVEVVGEVADLIVRCVDVDQMLCGTIIKDDAYLSARTSPRGGDATDLLLETIQDLGSGGGHVHRAGGNIVNARLRFEEHALADRLRSRWLAANNIPTDVAAVGLTAEE